MFARDSFSSANISSQRFASKTEFLIWKSQIVTSNSDKMGLRRPPYAFTEQGVAMLSGILNSDVAIDTNIKIIRAFVALRRIVSIPDTAERFNLIEKEIAFIKSEMEEPAGRFKR